MSRTPNQPTPPPPDPGAVPSPAPPAPATPASPPSPSTWSATGSGFVVDDPRAAGSSDSPSTAGWSMPPAVPDQGPAQPDLGSHKVPPSETTHSFSRCLSCGAGGSINAVTGMCPACARAFPTGVGAGFVPGEPVIIKDRQCLRCGYNLSGLRSDGVCPECGTGVARSLRGNLLRYSSPQYVGNLFLGLLLAEIGAVAWAAHVAIHFAGPLQKLMGPVAWVYGVVAGVVGIGGSVVSIIGWWLFSTRDPALIGKEMDVGARKLLRVAVVLDALFTLGPLAFKFLLHRDLFVIPTGSIWAKLGGALGVQIVSYGVFVLWFFASMNYLRSVVRRFPDARLYQQAQRLVWLGPVLSAVLCVAGFAATFVLYLLLIDRTRVLLSYTHKLAAAPSEPTTISGATP